MGEPYDPQKTGSKTRAKRKYEARNRDDTHSARFKGLRAIPTDGIPATLAEVQRLAAIATPKLLNETYWLAMHAKAENVRLAAQMAIYDRALGKPNQPLDISLDNGASLPLEDRERLIDLMAQLAGASPLTIDVTPAKEGTKPP